MISSRPVLTRRERLLPSLPEGSLPLGVPRADAWLGGGLRIGGLHEFYAASSGDGVSALGFGLLLGWMRRKNDDGRCLLWIRTARRARHGALPYGPGLTDLGIDPAMLRLIDLPDARAVLRASLDSARDGAVSALLIELGGRQPLLDLTATRRLVLAAAETNAMVLLVRENAEPSPSAAHTRWQVASAPSRALEADAPGIPRFNLDLLRQRGGRDGLNIVVEWDRDAAGFRERSTATAVAAAPLSGLVPAVDAGGTDKKSQTRAA